VDPFNKRDSVVHQESHRRSGALLSKNQKNVLRMAGYDPAQLPYAYAKILVGKTLDKWYPNRNKNS
jgi:hypothetical protein